MGTIWLLLLSAGLFVLGMLMIHWHHYQFARAKEGWHYLVCGRECHPNGTPEKRFQRILRATTITWRDGGGNRDRKIVLLGGVHHGMDFAYYQSAEAYLMGELCDHIPKEAILTPGRSDDRELEPAYSTYEELLTLKKFAGNMQVICERKQRHRVRLMCLALGYDPQIVVVNNDTGVRDSLYQLALLVYTFFDPWQFVLSRLTKQLKNSGALQRNLDR